MGASIGATGGDELTKKNRNEAVNVVTGACHLFKGVVGKMAKGMANAEEDGGRGVCRSKYGVRITKLVLQKNIEAETTLGSGKSGATNTDSEGI